jgi:hypothetical protein
MTFLTFEAKKWNVNSELCQVHTQVHARWNMITPKCISHEW